MPNKISDTTATERVLNLYTLLLLSQRPLSLTELTDKFQCSKATMLRTVRKVEAYAGAKLKVEERTTDGHTQHYYALERRSLDALRQSMVISADEMRLLALCRDIAAPFLPADINASLDATLTRTAVLLPKDEELHPPKHPWAQTAMLGSLDYTPLQKVLQTILQAIEDHIVCIVTYAAAGKPEREHEMALTNLTCGRQALYLNGWSVKDKGTPKARHPLFLAIHRIKKVELTRRKHQLQPPEYEAGFGVMEGTPFRVRVHIASQAAPYVRERIFGPEQTVEDAPDGSVILSFIARSVDELLGWILSFGRRARVLEPDFMVEKVREEARAILG